MQIVGFNFIKVWAERKPTIDTALSINTNIEFLDIEEDENIYKILSILHLLASSENKYPFIYQSVWTNLTPVHVKMKLKFDFKKNELFLLKTEPEYPLGKWDRPSYLKPFLSTSDEIRNSIPKLSELKIPEIKLSEIDSVLKKYKTLGETRDLKFNNGEVKVKKEGN